ncbi:glycosyltransferase [Autumnicola edwardsiae]|uniref:Glycosyltransferase n=1 Tax=Autumnicola edwardsiae TaxID=3075594 RepID=A0ABU3CS15_9FLAO|nr:glycosyltransferase [Zunongwangia sp. F297]MDT0649091.1 glycosyltransferase [Zunongwangia sp. F297]
MEPDEVLLSVSIITYNQKAYIKKAIDSVLMQEVNFKYEIIIGDDCSSDGTQEILKEYQEKYPDIIELILHPKRYNDIPGRTNNITNIYACRGKYIALLDGDDYWISKNKLQTQVDFLEKNQDYTLSFHNAFIHFDDNEAEPFYHNEEFSFLKEKETLTHEDIAHEWFIQTSSMMFRNHLIKEFPEWFWEVYSADYAIQLLISQHGKAKYFDELLSGRRMSNNSFSATNNTTIDQLNKRLQEWKVYKREFKAVKSSETFNRRLSIRYYIKAMTLLKLQKPSFIGNLLYSIYLDKRIAMILMKNVKKKILNQAG